MTLHEILGKEQNTFCSKTNDSVALVISARDWKRRIGGTYRPILKTHLDNIAEQCFLTMFLSWEQFLEESFLILLVRAKGGVRGVKSLLNVNSKKAAFNILKGDRNTYVEWSSVHDVKNRSFRFFKQGKPFSDPLGAGTLHLERMKKIRNRIAHRSPQADKKFKELIRELLGSYKQKTPGEFLLSTPPSNFGLISGTTNKTTVIETYAEILKTLVYQIAG